MTICKSNKLVVYLLFVLMAILSACGPQPGQAKPEVKIHVVIVKEKSGPVYEEVNDKVTPIPNRN